MKLALVAVVGVIGADAFLRRGGLVSHRPAAEPQRVRWQAVDDRSARGTLSDGPVTLTLLFGFGPDDLIKAVRADARGRTVGKKIVATPWQGRFWNYQLQGGMLVPLEGEVAWLLPEGAHPYWRGHLAEISYHFAR